MEDFGFIGLYVAGDGSGFHKETLLYIGLLRRNFGRMLEGIQPALWGPFGGPEPPDWEDLIKHVKFPAAETDHCWHPDPNQKDTRQNLLYQGQGSVSQEILSIPVVDQRTWSLHKDPSRILVRLTSGIMSVLKAG